MKCLLYFSLTILPYLGLANPPDTLNHFPNHRVRGGSSAFYQYIGKARQYPRPSRESATIGTSGSRVPKQDHLLAEKAITFYHKKKYKRTTKFLNELIRRNPFSKKLYEMRGYCRLETGDLVGACEDYRKIESLLHQSMPDTVRHTCQRILDR